MTADPPPTVSARRVAEAGPASGDFTYAVLPGPAGGGSRAEAGCGMPGGPSRGSPERRTAARRRTRLRSGKVVGADGSFVAECLIANRSTGGGLLRLPVRTALPDRILVYEDQTGDLFAAAVMWRRGCDLGIRFGSPARDARFQAIADSMRRKFYAMRERTR